MGRWFLLFAKFTVLEQQIKGQSRIAYSAISAAITGADRNRQALPSSECLKETATICRITWSLSYMAHYAKK